MKSTIGALSGAVLGYIANNYKGAKRGAAIGGAAGAKKVTQMAPVRKRKSTAKRGRTKRPKIEGRKRKKRYTVKAKTSKQLTKRIKGVVKRQLECDFNNSMWDYRQGSQFTPLSKGAQIVRTDSNSDDAPANADQQWIAFSPLQFLHAASKLYNAKISDNMFSTVGNFDTRGFKLNVMFAKHVINFKNVTGVKYNCELIKFRSKRNTSEKVYTQWGNQHNTIEWIGTVPNQTTYGARPQQLKAMGSKYKMDSKFFTLNPGHEYSTTDYFAGCIEWNKFLQEDGTTVTEIAKDITIEYMLILKPEVKLGVSAPPELANNLVGPYTAQGNDKRYAVVVDRHFKIKVQQPDETLDVNEGNFRWYGNNYVTLPDDYTAHDAYVEMPNLHFPNGAV